MSIAHAHSKDNELAVSRLTTLWALNECGLGGILHAVKSPFTGLIVASFTILILILINKISANPWKEVGKALMIVLLIKLIVSPHTNPTAYLAVSFQALISVPIIRWIRNITVASIILAVLSLLESAFQKVIVLTLVYGKQLWYVLDQWGDMIDKSWGSLLPYSTSEILIYTYVSIYSLAGILVGWFGSHWIKNILADWGTDIYKVSLSSDNQVNWKTAKSKKLKKRVILFSVLLACMILSFIVFGEDGESMQQIGYLLLRVGTVLLVWVYVLLPLIRVLLNKFLANGKNKYQQKIASTLDAMPYMMYLVQQAWINRRGNNILQRSKHFIHTAILNCLQAELPN